MLPGEVPDDPCLPKDTELNPTEITVIKIKHLKKWHK